MSRTRRRARRQPRHGFTLIELLVVISIVGLLVGILLPALGAARHSARLTACASNLKQIGTAIHAYAGRHYGKLPVGPDPDFARMANSQIWSPPGIRVGLGLLLHTDLSDPNVLFCPGDDTNDPVEELDKLQRGDPNEMAFSSYLYRQLHATTKDRLEDLGESAPGLPAAALAMDSNSLGPETFNLHRTNHNARRVNILFTDGSVRGFANDDGRFNLRAQDFATFPGSMQSLIHRLDHILRTADALGQGREP
jgi:prepilin-type N-terminal cleavage/methylation domain-containing protein/prepilin-type processing-associated H-X9-DG protein